MRPHALSREQARSVQQQLLWTPQALSRWGAAVALSGVLLLGSWYSIAGKTTWEDQVASMNVGIAGALGAVSAGLFLVLAGRRAIGVRRVALLGQPALLAAAYPGGAQATEVVSTSLVAGEGLKHFHRSDCPLAAQKAFLAASRSAHVSDGRTGCGVCRP